MKDAFVCCQFCRWFHSVSFHFPHLFTFSFIFLLDHSLVLLQWTQNEKKMKKRDDFFSKLFETAVAIISQSRMQTKHAAIVSKPQFLILEYYKGSQCIVGYHRRRLFVHFVFGLKLEVFIVYNNNLFAKICR